MHSRDSYLIELKQAVTFIFILSKHDSIISVVSGLKFNQRLEDSPPKCKVCFLLECCTPKLANQNKWLGKFLLAPVEQKRRVVKTVDGETARLGVINECLLDWMVLQIALLALSKM